MRAILYRFIKWAIRKYFREGLTPIWGRADWDGKPIAWCWRWMDEKYEKYRTYKRKKLFKQIRKENQEKIKGENHG